MARRTAAVETRAGGSAKVRAMAADLADLAAVVTVLACEQASRVTESRLRVDGGALRSI